MSLFDKKYLVLFFVMFIASLSFAQEVVIYKEIGQTKLELTVYSPGSINTALKYPALVFFYGGGWNAGSISQFQPHAEYFSKKGFVCFLVDYRTKKKNNTSPFEAVKDAKSAIRYIRQHATKFLIDTSKIIAAGGSAGGHLAAATAVVEKYNEGSDDIKISCKPNALVLYNPVIDNGPGGYGYERVGEEYRFFSPLHNIHTGAPPTIIMLGTKDHLIPVQTAQYYKTVMDKVGARCDLVLYENAGHGFFNYKKDNDYYHQTLAATEKFLQSLNYISN